MSAGSLSDVLSDVPDRLFEGREMQPLAFVLGRGGAAARDAYRSCSLQNFRLVTALGEILRALHEAGVAAQPLKGGAFLTLLYGDDLGARPMGDLDILVAPAQVRVSSGILQGLGYIASLEGSTNDRAFERLGVRVELHWGLFHDLDFDPDPTDLLADTVVTRIEDCDVAVARPVVQLFYVLAHAATHALRHNEIWIVDALLLVRRLGPIAWLEVEAVARRHRALRAVRAAARQVNAHFPGTFPVPPPRRLRDRVLASIASPHSRPIAYGFGVRSILVRLLLAENMAAAHRMVVLKLRSRVGH